MPSRSPVARASLCAAAFALLAPMVPANAASAASAARPVPINDFTVYGFSQSDVDQEDPQIFELAPDINIRSIGKWSTNGDEAGDYNFDQIRRYRAKNITFMGGGTASIIFPGDFPSPAVFDDMSTRDAENNPVPHDEFGFEEPARRGNIFNPKFRRYVLSWAKIQIDGGADGVFFDEINAGFGGGAKYSFNGNEGFDDYALGDFNAYLLAKYPKYQAADWKAKFGMTDGNLPRRDVPACDLARNFNYRTYLAAHGWNTNPVNADNPLAPEWGRVVPNRLYAEDTTFLGTYLRKYWKAMVDETRAYAARTAHRKILITSNGLWPHVDFNAVGMYPWNSDEQTPDYRGADYVPVVDGHLNGAKSLQSQYRYLKDQNARIAGAVPVSVFIDWPNDMMTAYLNLPTAEQQDYWRIFGAEAYANGLFPAFHLKDTVGSPTADQLGLLGFLKTYSQFYRANAPLFRSNDVATQAVTVSAAKVVASLLVQRGTGKRTIHLVNHDYAEGITPASNLTVQVNLPSCPRTVSLVSPDFAGRKTPASRCTGGRLTVTVERLDYSAVLALS